MQLSDWQDGVPSVDGIYQIFVPEHIKHNFDGAYYARFKNGKWNVGYHTLEHAKKCSNYPYKVNNNPDNSRKWRGVIDE